MLYRPPQGPPGAGLSGSASVPVPVTDSPANAAAAWRGPGLLTATDTVAS